MEHGDASSPAAGAPAPGDPSTPSFADLMGDRALAAAVEEALSGDILADLPEAQPERTLRSVTDFSSLYVRHRSGLAAHARRYLRDRRDVDEVVQETFLRLFLAISEIETELQAIAFARRTLTNLCIDRYRAERRRPTLITLDASPFYDLTGADEEPDPVLQAEDAAIVREALARLSPLHRAALVKREIEEKALPQIAAELGVAEDSVKHLLFRARRALRRLLVGTSVEPGVDLTGEEAGGSRLLRGATVFILFLVGALVVSTGLRPLLSGSGGDGRPAAGPLGLGLPEPDQGRAPSTLTPSTLRPSTLKPKATGPAKAAVSKSGAHGRTPTAVVTSPASVSAPFITISAPRPAPAHHPVRRAPTGISANRGHFRLSGPLTVTGTPQVTEGGVARQGDTILASSSFSAPTDQGTFELNQTLTTSSTGGATMAVTPAFVVGGQVQQPTLTGSAAAVGSNADGNVTVDLIAGARPDTSTNAFPMTALAVHVELTPDLSDVLSETVTLSTRPATAAAPVAGGNGGAPPASGTAGSSGPGTAQTGTATGTQPPGTSGSVTAPTGAPPPGTSGSGTAQTGTNQTDTMPAGTASSAPPTPASSACASGGPTTDPGATTPPADCPPSP